MFSGICFSFMIFSSVLNGLFTFLFNSGTDKWNAIRICDLSTYIPLQKLQDCNVHVDFYVTLRSSYSNWCQKDGIYLHKSKEKRKRRYTGGLEWNFACTRNGDYSAYANAYARSRIPICVQTQTHERTLLAKTMPLNAFSCKCMGVYYE